VALNTYLFFDGNCADAMRFYERTLGGKLEMMTHAASPMGPQASAANADRIMHARLETPNGVLMASDTMAGHAYEGKKGFSIALTLPSAPDAKRVFEAMAEGGKVTMPLQKTFWAEAFGEVVDRFGTPWMINTATQQT
jgi:PhnB protein